MTDTAFTVIPADKFAWTGTVGMASEDTLSVLVGDLVVTGAPFETDCQFQFYRQIAPGLDFSGSEYFQSLYGDKSFLIFRGQTGDAGPRGKPWPKQWTLIITAK